MGGGVRAKIPRNEGDVDKILSLFRCLLSSVDPRHGFYTKYILQFFNGQDIYLVTL
jgi:hypothetical protein